MTATSRRGAQRRPARSAAAQVVGLPTRVTLLFFWTALVVAVTVLLGVFTPVVVLPTLAVVVAGTWRLAPEPVRADPAAARTAVAALGLAAAWTAVNVWFAGEVLLVQRDPGFLTLEGVWLSGSADPDIPIRSAAAVADAVPAASAASDAFWRDGGVIYAQGAKTFPGLLGLAGWVAGQPGVLAANVLIGAVALLAVFDLGRRLASARWALLAMLALALSTPMLYFTRSPFTEPTNIAVTFGGLVALWGAVRDPAERGALGRFALAGAMVGASALSRIDGAAVVAGLVLALGLVAAATRDGARRAARVRGFWAASAAAGSMVLLGYLDVRVNSAQYLADHDWLYRPLVALLVVSWVAAAGLIVIARPRFTAWLAARSAPLAAAAAGGLILVCLGLASRPLWTMRHGVVPDSGQAQFVAAFQRAAGVAVDPTRSYDEMTVAWLVWYLGPITVLLAALGVAAMARESVLRRRPELLAYLVTLGVPSLLYLIRPSITPDQIWAMRRFLPAAIPAAVLCAVWLLEQIRLRPGQWARVGSAIGAVLVVLAPLATWGTLVATPEYAGRVGQVEQLCDHTRGQRVVVVRGAGPPLLPTLRVLCDADVVEVPGPATRSGLAEVVRAWGGAPVLVVANTEDAIEWPDGQDATLSTAMARWPHSLYPSFGPIRYTSQVWVGTLGEDGRVTPVEQPPAAPARAPA